MASVTALMFLVLAVVPAIATDYTVGDTNGWSQGVDYSTWVSDKTFKVGDTLTFQYGFLHTVDEVGKSDYDACSSSNSLQSHSDQNTKITLSKPGTRYFICGTSGHCANGMKLAVPVLAASAPSTPSTPTPTPTTPSSSTPTETPASTPSTPSSTPIAKTPSSNNTPTTIGSSNGAAAVGRNIVMIGMSLVGAALL